METVVHNHDSYGHNVTVESIAHGEPIEHNSFHIEPGSTVVVELHPASTEVAVYPDESADAVQSVNAHALGMVPATSAVSIFSIINGVGGAASQLIAANKLADTGEVPLRDVGIGGVVAILGAIAGVYLM